ncbi:peptide ABC transporter ATP-binding protein [candidate division KSB3 bacterium]|uniref:Nickel import system ATP-binding protein NikD n=1 Tax=candidate division KSB3 bacterium TaxID=2044937 RepID=A0A2G6E6L1_9BACT|nr:MAG: peptide ABC transporter ATP-binding protein [candidate division KSB3 bacterium]PIE30143.1 MAG: peptide ABC transporter ATP-binding protein [candidate division KSB3 bacterium]
MLKLHNLSVEFLRYQRNGQRRPLTVISSLDLEVQAGHITAVLGSSGAGKSVLAHAILGILPKNVRMHGEIEFHGQALTQERIRRIRGKEIALIPQSTTFLNPLLRVGRQVCRASRLSGVEQKTASENSHAAFQRYHLGQEVNRLYPFQLSGGMARRVLTAAATAGKAELLIADEPTSGLDPHVSAESLAHLRELADQGKGVILITHDIQAALTVADTVTVFYAGTTLEIAANKDFQTPERLRHPYTRALLRALPQYDFTFVPGVQPSPEDLPAGCLFFPRCEHRQAKCEFERPGLEPLRGGYVRCFYA